MTFAALPLFVQTIVCPHRFPELSPFSVRTIVCSHKIPEFLPFSVQTTVCLHKNPFPFSRHSPALPHARPLRHRPSSERGWPTVFRPGHPRSISVKALLFKSPLLAQLEETEVVRVLRIGIHKALVRSRVIELIIARVLNACGITTSPSPANCCRMRSTQPRRLHTRYSSS